MIQCISRDYYYLACSWLCNMWSPMSMVFMNEVEYHILIVLYNKVHCSEHLEPRSFLEPKLQIKWKVFIWELFQFNSLGVKKMLGINSHFEQLNVHDPNIHSYLERFQHHCRAYKESEKQKLSLLYRRLMMCSRLRVYPSHWRSFLLAKWRISYYLYSILNILKLSKGINFTWLSNKNMR